MKRMIKASNLTDYTVSVNFGGYIGGDAEYSVMANNDEEAKVTALEEAKSDLTVEDINEDDEGEWTVTIGFDGLIGVENNYVVYADDEAEAEEAALQEAEDDLSAEIL